MRVLLLPLLLFSATTEADLLDEVRQNHVVDAVLAEKELEDVFDYISGEDLIDQAVEYFVDRYAPFHPPLDEGQMTDLKKEYAEFLQSPEELQKEVLSGFPSKFHRLPAMLKEVSKKWQNDFNAFTEEEKEVAITSFDYAKYMLVRGTALRSLRKFKRDYKKRGLTKKEIKQDITDRARLLRSRWEERGHTEELRKMDEKFERDPRHREAIQQVKAMEKAKKQRELAEEREEAARKKEEPVKPEVVKEQSSEKKKTGNTFFTTELEDDFDDAGDELPLMKEYVATSELAEEAVSYLAHYLIRAPAAGQIGALRVDFANYLGLGPDVQKQVLMGMKMKVLRQLQPLLQEVVRIHVRELAGLPEEERELFEDVYDYTSFSLTSRTALRLIRKNKAEYRARGLSKKQIAAEVKTKGDRLFTHWMPANNKQRNLDKDVPIIGPADFDIVQEMADSESVDHEYYGYREMIVRVIGDLCARYTPLTAYSAEDLTEMQLEFDAMIQAGRANGAEDWQELIEGRTGKYPALAPLFDAFRYRAFDEFEALSEEDQARVESFKHYMSHIMGAHMRLRVSRENAAEAERLGLTKEQYGQELDKRDEAILASWEDWQKKHANGGGERRAKRAAEAAKAAELERKSRSHAAMAKQLNDKIQRGGLFKEEKEKEELKFFTTKLKEDFEKSEKELRGMMDFVSQHDLADEAVAFLANHLVLPLKKGQLAALKMDFVKYLSMGEEAQRLVLTGTKMNVLRDLPLLLFEVLKIQKREYEELPWEEWKLFKDGFDYMEFTLMKRTALRVVRRFKADYMARGLSEAKIKQEVIERQNRLSDSWRKIGGDSRDETNDVPIVGLLGFDMLQELREHEQADLDYVGNHETNVRTIDELCARYTPWRSYSEDELTELQINLDDIINQVSRGNRDEWFDMIDGTLGGRYPKLEELFVHFREGASREFAVLPDAAKKHAGAVDGYMSYILGAHVILPIYRANKAEWEARGGLGKPQIRKEHNRRGQIVVDTWAAWKKLHRGKKRSAGGSQETNAKEEL